MIAGDSAFPLIADVTAPFVYARIMGTREDEAGDIPTKRWKCGRSGAGLGSRRAPGDLAGLRPAAKAKGRDVFLYVISGFKRAILWRPPR